MSFDTAGGSVIALLDKHPIASTGTGALTTFCAAFLGQVAQIESALRLTSLIVSILCGAVTLVLALRRLDELTIHPRLVRWLKGLWKAFVIGATNVLANVVVTPDTFNFGAGLVATGKLALVSGALALFLELRKSPVPEDEQAAVQTPGK